MSTTLKPHFGKMGILKKIVIFCLNFPLAYFYSTEMVGRLISDVLESPLNTWR